MITEISIRHHVNLLLIGLVWAGFALHLWGIRGNLPYAAEIDEPVFVTRAIRMAATGDLNPRWFGHPGSTLIYPLAGLYHLGRSLVSPGILLQPDPTLQTAFKVSPSEFYLFGRYLTIGYAVASLPLVYHLGRRAFGRPAGLIGAGLATLPVIAVAHSQMVRTDSAATFFGLLSLLLLELTGRGSYRLTPFPPERRRIDIGDAYSSYALIEGQLGWRPCVPLVEGLARTLAYYREFGEYYWQ